MPGRRCSALSSANDQASLDKEIRSGRQADGTPLTAEQQRKDEDKMQLECAFTSEAVAVHRTYPTLTYADQLTLYHAGREFRLMNMVSDAYGSTGLYLPREKVLVAGDVVSYPVPYFTRSTQQAASLRALSRLDVDVIISSHGPAWHDKAT
jgi:cyclase